MCVSRPWVGHGEPGRVLLRPIFPGLTFDVPQDIVGRRVFRWMLDAGAFRFRLRSDMSAGERALRSVAPVRSSHYVALLALREQAPAEHRSATLHAGMEPVGLWAQLS